MPVPVCSEFSCTDKLQAEYSIINRDDNTVVGFFCKKHGEEAITNPNHGYAIEKIPQPDVQDIPRKGQGATAPAPRKPQPTNSQPQPDLAPAPAEEKGVRPMSNSSDIAPEYAVFDEQAEEGTEESPQVREATENEASSNFRWQFWPKDGEKGYDIQSTIRGSLPAGSMERHLREVSKVIRFIQAKGGAGILNAEGMTSRISSTQNPAPQQATGQAPQQAPQGQAPRQAPQQRTPSPSQNPPGMGPNGKPVAEFVTKMMQIQPMPKGTTQIKFFASKDARGPIKTVTKQPQNWVPLFESCGDTWEQAHFTQAGEWDISYLVRWEQGQPVPGGTGFFTNILSITPA